MLNIFVKYEEIIKTKYFHSMDFMDPLWVVLCM